MAPFFWCNRVQYGLDGFEFISTPDCSVYKGVRVVVVKTYGEIATVFPDSDQSTVLKER